MVKIRLTRGGTKKQPYYRIVAIDSRNARDGRAIDFLGTYHPVSRTEQISLKEEKIVKWIDEGAQVSPTVKDVLKKAGLIQKINEQAVARKVALKKKKKEKAKAAPAATSAE